MKKIVLFTLIISMFACTVAFAGTPMFENENKDAVKLYEFPGDQNPTQLKGGSDIGQYIMVDAPWSEIHLNCPSWSNNIGSMTFKLFVWQGDYDSTVKSTPIAEEKYVDFNDNAWLIHKANGGAYAAGEYLWILTEPVENVGIWKATYESFDTEILQVSYLGGEEKAGCYVAAIVYAEEGANIVAGGAGAANNNTTVKTAPKDTENIVMYVDNSKAFVRGTEKNLDVAPTVLNGRTFLPVRFVAENFGCVVNWDETTQTVVIEKEDKIIALTIGESAIRVSGDYKTIDAAPYVTEGRTMVPIRAIAEALGMQVEYFDPGLIAIGPHAKNFDTEKANAFIEFYR